MKYLWRNKIILLLIILIIVFMKPAIGLPEQSKTENIVTAIGIDKLADEFEVSLQYILPYKSGSENELKLITMKGKNLSETIESVSIQLGKESGFAHCKFILLSNSACEENITSIIDYFMRIKSNANNITLITTPEPVKDVLGTSSNLDSELYTVIDSNNNIAFHRHHLNFNDIGDYYASYLGHTKCISLNIMETEEDTESPDSSTGGGGGASSSSDTASGGSSTQPPKKKIKNEGKVAILKDGKRLVSLTSDESEKLSYFDPQIKDHYLTLEHFSDEVYDDVDISFNIYEKGTKVTTSFVQGVPHYTLNLNLHVRANQIISDDMTKYYDFSKNHASEKLKNTIEDQLKTKLLSAEAHFKANKYDVVNCYENLYKFQNGKFKEFLQTLGADEYFIEKVVFDYKLNISQHL